MTHKGKKGPAGECDWSLFLTALPQGFTEEPVWDLDACEQRRTCRLFCQIRKSPWHAVNQLVCSPMTEGAWFWPVKWWCQQCHSANQKAQGEEDCFKGDLELVSTSTSQAAVRPHTEPLLCLRASLFPQGRGLTPTQAFPANWAVLEALAPGICKVPPGFSPCLCPARLKSSKRRTSFIHTAGLGLNKKEKRASRPCPCSHPPP